MTLAIAIVSLLTALVPLLIWYVKRKQSPSLEEEMRNAEWEYEGRRAQPFR